MSPIPSLLLSTLHEEKKQFDIVGLGCGPGHLDMVMDNLNYLSRRAGLRSVIEYGYRL